MGEAIIVKGRHQVLFRKGARGEPDFGSLAGVTAGDLIAWNDNGNQLAEVEKVVGTKWTRRFKTRAATYRGLTVKKSVTIDAADVREALRLLPGAKPPRRLDDG